MKALILRSDPDDALATARVMTEKGFQVMCLQSLKVAHALIRLDTFDVIVMDESVDDQLTHAVALSAERRNAGLSAIVLTDRSQTDTDDLYDLVPSLYALVGTQTSPELLGRLALSAVGDMDRAKDNIFADVPAEPEFAMPEAVAEAIPEPELEEALPPLVLSSDLSADADDVPTVKPALPEFLSARSTESVTSRPAVSPAATPQEAFTVSRAAEAARVDDAVLAKVAELFRSTPLPSARTQQPRRRAQAS